MVSEKAVLVHLIFLNSWNVITCLSNNTSVDVMYLDLTKAFSEVPHIRLLRKLRAHGIGGAVFHWIPAWLSNRSTTVH